MRSSNLEAQLLGLLRLNGPLLACCDVLGLNAHDTSAPAPLHLGVVVELGLEVANQGGQLLLILRLHRGDGNAGASLLVNQLTQARLALDDAVWHVLLAAKRRQPAHQLDGIHIMGDHNQLGPLLLNQSRDVIEAVLQHRGLLRLDLLAVLLLLCHLHEPSLLHLLGLWGVLLAQLQQGGSLVLVDSHAELVDGWRHLQPHQHDALLSLQADVLGPLHESGQVTLGLDVTPQSVVSGRLLEERILLCLLLFVGQRCRRELLAALGGLSHGRLSPGTGVGLPTLKAA
mmetsp:Transcript_33921/g.76172  ORF Transcript_33921/g.76172 Transcript_33921/m.76172 type:complete len:286 (-) Transcript_33921:8-865(-)